MKKMSDDPELWPMEANLRPRDPIGIKAALRRSENPVLKVFICIRLKPKSKNPVKAWFEFRNNLRRARTAARYAVLHGYDPEATTIYYTQFLDAFSQLEGDWGGKLGQFRLYNCNELWDVRDEGEEPSSEMKNDIEFAKVNDIKIKSLNFSEIKAWIKNYDKTSH